MRKQTWLILVLAAILSMAFVACGRSSATLTVDPSAASAAVMAESPTNVQVESPAPASAQLDPGEIVAAYEEVLSNIYESALPSVVYIVVEKRVAPQSEARQGGFFGPQQSPDGFVIPGAGSGFVWSAEGHVVTNHHVIEDAYVVRVIFADGSEFEAEVLGSDPGSDLAVLKIEAPEQELKAVRLAGQRPAKGRSARRGHWQPIRPGVHDDPRHSQRLGTHDPERHREFLQPADHSDGRAHQPRELGRTAVGLARQGHRDQLTDNKS